MAKYDWMAGWNFKAQASKVPTQQRNFFFSFFYQSQQVIIWGWCMDFSAKVLDCLDWEVPFVTYWHVVYLKIYQFATNPSICVLSSHLSRGHLSIGLPIRPGAGDTWLLSIDYWFRPTTLMDSRWQSTDLYIWHPLVFVKPRPIFLLNNIPNMATLLMT